MTNVVLNFVVGVTTITYEYQSSAAPFPGLHVQILPDGAKYPIFHKVKQLFYNLFTDTYTVELEGTRDGRSSVFYSNAERESDEKFCATLISYGWRKSE